MTTLAAHFDPLVQPLRGVHAIEASAGTGKTYSITLLWLRLLIEHRLRVDEILVTTFTRAATAELKERLLASLRRALAAAKQVSNDDCPEAKIVTRATPSLGERNLVKELELALSTFDLAPICTIHGFCQSLISRHALELGCDPALELSESADSILEELVSDRLMFDANDRVLERSEALRVAQVAVNNPLGRIPEPIERDAAIAESYALLNPFLDRLSTLTLSKASLGPVRREIESMRDTGKAKRFSPAQKKGLAPILDELDEAMELVRAKYRAINVAELHPFAALARHQFATRKAAAGIRTFDDILLTVHQALLAQRDENSLTNTIRERFKAAIVDECQDSDGIQIDVFQRLFTRANSFIVIGDPKQSIYRFRGADLSSYQRLAADAKRAPDLVTNYRSDRPLVDALNRLYERCPTFRGGTREHPIRYVTVNAQAESPRIVDARVSEPILLLWSDATERGYAKRDLARRTALEYRRLLDEPVTIIDRNTKQARRLVASDLAVLAATHDELDLVRRELLALRIPCEQAGASLGSVWSSDEAADVQTWLEAVKALEERIDPLAAMLAFAATPLFGLTTPELYELSIDPARQATVAQRLVADHERLRYIGPLSLLQQYWNDVERLEVRLGTRDGERRMTNWRHVGSLLQTEWGKGRNRASELALWLARKRGSNDSVDEGTLMKLETDLPAVQLVTIFGAKGLEYPVVACPFLWHVKSRTLREKSPVAVVRHPNGTIIDIGSDAFSEHLEEAIQQEDEEQERLLYVALTRPRHRLYLGLAPVESGDNHDNGAERSALATLLGLESVDKSEWSSRSPIPTLALTRPQESPFTAFTPVDTKAVLATPPVVEHKRGPLTRCSSYSALTRGEETTKDYDPEERTEQRRLPGLLGELNLSGNRLGQRVHSLLEDYLGNGRTLDTLVEHLEPAWKSALTTMVDTPFCVGNATVSLSQVRDRAIAEMHVLLPVRNITPEALSLSLLADPLISNDPERRTWAEGITEWSFSTLAGFFQGYIDLVFEHAGRFYIVDYKTNALPGYDPDAITTAMLDHHYILQARLYTVALHRHLRATYDGYDPEQHLGGTAYLFVRGFPDQGVWFERPSVSAVAALDALFAEAAL